MNTKKLDEFLSYITKTRIPGAECLIIKSGKQIYREAFGYADLETKTPMEQDRFYNIYSATKPVTCAAALKLFEEGKISLDDPVSKFLPEFSDMYVLKDGKSKKAEQTMTIKHLLTMTSGIDFNIRTSQILSAKKQGKTSTRDIVREISKDYLRFEPGEDWFYGLSHDVLGAAIEEASGMSLLEYMKKNLFEPLDMPNTTFHLTEDLTKKMATQYYFNDETQKPDKAKPTNLFKLTEKYECGGAGLISCVSEYANFTQMLTSRGKFKNTRILKEETVDLMRKSHLTDNQLKTYAVRSRKDYSYGLGVRVMVDRDKFGSPSQNGEFGWGGAGGVYMAADPENELSIIYFQHLLNNESMGLDTKLREVIYDAVNS